VDNCVFDLTFAQNRNPSHHILWIPRRNIKLHSTKYWGLGESAWIIWHFHNEGHSVPDSVRQVIGPGHATSHEGQNKGTYPNLHDFRELGEDCMLIHHEEMVAILLHGFVYKKDRVTSQFSFHNNLFIFF
jgi:hypothetical protein